MITALICKLPVILYSGLIFYLSSTAQDMPGGVSDKILHLFAYGGYALLAYLFFYDQLPKKRFIYSFLLTTIFGLSDEIHQFFIPGRYCEFLDFVFDTSGGIMMLGLIGMINIFFVQNIKRTYKESK